MPPAEYHDALQNLCEVGQQRLMAMQYLDAEKAFVDAEEIALARGDLDTLGRLYFPLQEARRQRRQVCGEGMVWLDGPPVKPEEEFDAAALLAESPQGQFLVPGWGDTRPGAAIRREAAERKLYAEAFLAAAFPAGRDGALLIALLPFERAELPKPEAVRGNRLALERALPAGSVLLDPATIPPRQLGDAGTFAWTMARWEALAAPYLSAANELKSTPDRIAGFRRAIAADYACEKAHQWLATTALDAARANRSAVDAGSDEAAVADGSRT